MSLIHITYFGDGVVRIDGAGVFQNGTSAWVPRRAARTAMLSIGCIGRVF